VAELPSGTVTFLFTDLEVSTRLWEQEPVAMRGALARHDVILRGAVSANGGHLVKGTGDGVHAAFGTAEAAVAAAVAAQLALLEESWAVAEPLRVRMGIHTGAAELRDGEYADCRPSFVFHVYGHEFLKRFEMTEMMPWLLWNNLPPMRRRRRCLRCAHQPEIRRVKVSADEERITDVIDLIDQASPARLNDLQLSRWLIDRHIAKLAGALLTDAD